MSDVSTFASSDTTNNKPSDPFKAVLSTVYTLGKQKGKGDGSRFAYFDTIRVGASDGTIEYQKPKRGKGGGAKDDSHIAKISKRYIDGVVDGGGESSKATQKNKVNNICLAFTDPDEVWQTEATWEAVKKLHASYEKSNKAAAKEDTVPINDIADAMLAMAGKLVKGYATKGGHIGRALTEEEITACVLKRKAAPKELVEVVKAMVTRGTKQASEDGDAVSPALVALLDAARAFVEEQNSEDEAADEEAQQFGSIDALIKKGKIVVAKNGTLRIVK